MEKEDIKLKIKMPMIPLRDVVIFPNTVSTLFVGREKSIFSLEDALRSNKKIFLIAQNSPSNEEPTIKDLPQIGTISTLLQMIKLPDGTVKILVSTGQTLRENNLEESSLVMQITSKLIINKIAYKLMNDDITKILNKFKKVLNGKNFVRK